MPGGFQHPNAGGFGGDPLVDAATQFIFPKLFGQDLGPFSFNIGQNIQDTRQASVFQRGQMGAAMNLGGAGFGQSMEELIRGRKPGGGISGILGWDSETTTGAVDLFQGADVGRMMGMAAPALSMMLPAGAMDEMGAGGFQQGANIAGMFRNSGMSSEQITSTATGLGAYMNQNLFSGDLSATHGYDKGAASGFMRGAKRAGRGPGQYNPNTDAGKQHFADWTAGLTGPMSAIRDLGGQYANMNPEQMQVASDQVTMGGWSAGVDNDTLQDQTRMFKQLTEASDISYDAGVGLQQMAGARSAQMGGDMLSGVEAGQHGMAFGAAAKQQGGDFLGASNGASMAEMMQQDALLTVQAGRSEQGNMASSLMRMGKSGMLREGSEAQKMYTDLKDNDNFTAMKSGEFNTMLKKSGVNMSSAAKIQRQRGQNADEFGDKVAPAVRKTQWDADIAPKVQRAVANEVGGGKRGMKAGQAVADIMRDMAGESQEDVEAAIAAEFKTMGAGRQAREAATIAYGAASEVGRGMGYKGAGNMANVHSKEVLDAVDDVKEAGKEGADVRREKAGDAQKGVVGRTFDAIKDGVSGLGDFASKVVGALGDDASKDVKQDGGDGVVTVRIDPGGEAVPVRVMDDDVANPDVGAGITEQ